jgi:hypothetical protein
MPQHVKKAPRCGSEPPRPRYPSEPRPWRPKLIICAPYSGHFDPIDIRDPETTNIPALSLLLRASPSTYPLRLCYSSSADEPKSNLSDQLQQTPILPAPNDRQHRPPCTLSRAQDAKA